MRKQVALIVAMLFILISAMPVFAARNDIAVTGNATNYGTNYISVSQVNSTIKSSQYLWFRSQIRINTTGTDTNATLTALNYTLADEKYAGVSDSDVRLLNSSLDLITTATTYSDGTYKKARFTGTNLAANANAQGLINNFTSTTFYIEYPIATRDSNRSVSTSVSDIHYTENVTYWGLSDLTLSGLTLVYKPTQWTKLQAITEVQYDGTAVTNYTEDATLGILYDPEFAADSEHFLLVKYTVPESGKGATGAGRTPPLTIIPPQPLPTLWIVIVMGLAVICMLIVAMAYYWKK